jgi:DNA modification methylase
LTTPYYSDDHVTLYCGDSLEILPTLQYDAMVTDPPYGIAWKGSAYNGARPHDGIANDDTTDARDAALRLCGDRPAIVFGSVYCAPPATTRHVAVWHKPPDSGVIGAQIGLRRDIEAVYFLGEFAQRSVYRSSVFTSKVAGAGPHAKAVGHPHAKPLDLMRTLIQMTPDDAVIVDPFAGSGSTLRAAKDLGRKAIGVEIEPQYCDAIVNRLAQEVLPL